MPLPHDTPHTLSTTVEGLEQCRIANFKNFPPPPDLTPYITKADDQYVAGGGFGDVYRCWYCDGSPKEVRVSLMTHAACYLPLPQVAVKAFRFMFAIDGDANDRPVKVTHVIHTQEVRSKLPRRCSVESLAFGGDSITSMSFRSWELHMGLGCVVQCPWCRYG